MRLYVMRHASAVDVGEKGVRTDSERTLSAEGRQEAKDVAEALAAMGVRPDCVGASPLVRADATARIVAGVLCEAAPLESCDFLEPGGNTSSLIAWLRQHSASSALVVGHMPDLIEMISELIGGRGKNAIALKKAGVACVFFDKAPATGAGMLEWLLQLEQLRSLRRRA